MVDGIDLRLSPDNVREDPIERTAVASGLFGKVHFLWPESAALSLLSVTYQGVTREEALRLIAALGPRTVRDKTLSFLRDAAHSGIVIPGAVSLRLNSAGEGRWNVSVECPARSLLYAGGVAT